MAEKRTLYQVIAEQLGVSEDEVTSEMSLEDLGADSLDVVELMMAIEEDFGIEIPDDDVKKLKTVGELDEYLQRVTAPK